MNTAFSPFSASTVVSLTLHAALVVAFLPMQPDVMNATGKGIAIELVSSSYVSNHERTERAASKANTMGPSADQPAGTITATAANGSTVKSSDVEREPNASAVVETQSVDHDTGEKVLTASTDSSAHSSSIAALLHTSISEHKQYPYLAMRQRREGVARVEFVLHPDGAIHGTRLVQSSRTRLLDKAAMDAVKRIEPFELAKDYLDRPEAFQVDVVFNVM
jgi:TonB family protein